MHDFSLHLVFLSQKVYAMGMKKSWFSHSLISVSRVFGYSIAGYIVIGSVALNSVQAMNLESLRLEMDGLYDISSPEILRYG